MSSQVKISESIHTAFTVESILYTWKCKKYIPADVALPAFSLSSCMNSGTSKQKVLCFSIRKLFLLKLLF